ncbi:MAG: hypothetical protein JWM40_873 [Frankiales bacterium]|nr:hypothetical protein [Frankiales bacterium]
MLGAAIEVGCWAMGTVLTRGSWRYNISALYAQGAPRPVLVMAGEAAFAVALSALALALHRGLPASDFRWVASGLLALASAGALAGALARNGCEESVPSCHGSTFATAADWVHGVGGLVEILGIAGAALVLVGVLPRPWSSWSAATASVVLGAVLLSDAVPYPWTGTAQRIMILVIVGWAAGVGAWVGSIVPAADAAREPATS